MSTDQQLRRIAADKSPKEIHELAAYAAGYADCARNDTLAVIAILVEKLANNICAGGVVGCRGGERCDSDHK